MSINRWKVAGALVKPYGITLIRRGLCEWWKLCTHGIVCPFQLANSQSANPVWRWMWLLVMSLMYHLFMVSGMHLWLSLRLICDNQCKSAMYRLSLARVPRGPPMGCLTCWWLPARPCHVDVAQLLACALVRTETGVSYMAVHPPLA